MKKLIKFILQTIFIFSVPFIIPAICKILIKLGLFDSISELKEIVSVFNNWNTMLYIAIGVAIFIYWFCRWESVKEFVRNRDFLFNFKEKTVSANKTNVEELNRADEQKKFINKITEENKIKNSDTTIQEMKNMLGISKKMNDNYCTECNENKSILEKEVIKLRDFATYNIINTDAKTLLHIIYNENYIETDKFKSRIIQGYKRRNRRNQKFSKKDVNKIARNKYETIYDGLKFLNIIEPSEDDKVIRLTKEGKEYVKKYIEQEEEVI